MAYIQHSTNDLYNYSEGKQEAFLLKKKKKNQRVFLIWSMGSNNLVSGLAKEK